MACQVTVPTSLPPELLLTVTLLPARRSARMSATLTLAPLALAVKLPAASCETFAVAAVLMVRLNAGVRRVSRRSS